MPTVLITGVAGFLGRAFAREFSSNGWTVAGLDILSTENAATNHLTHYYCLPLPNPILTRIVSEIEPDVVIHSAGRASVPLSFDSPADDFLAGPQVTASVLEAIRTCGRSPRFIFCSSAAVYGNPTSLPISEESPTAPISPYGFNKLIAELLCKEYHTCFNIPISILRIFSAYGPGLRRQVVYEACKQANSGRILLYGTGQETRDFVHASDVARAAFLSSTTPSPCQILNVASGIETSVQAVADTIKTLANQPVEVAYRNESYVGVPIRWQADISRLKSLGFTPNMTLKKGLQGMLRWCEAESGNS